MLAFKNGEVTSNENFESNQENSSDIFIKDLLIRNLKLGNTSFENINLDNLEDLEKFIDKQKIVFEDYWKLKNIINTSIKLDLTISVDNSNIIKIDQFEETLSNIELVNNFNIFKFDNKKNIYKIIFNGTRDQFLDVMEDYDYFFEIKNKIWLLK